jgi:hypothetical protein
MSVKSWGRHQRHLAVGPVRPLFDEFARILVGSSEIQPRVNARPWLQQKSLHFCCSMRKPVEPCLAMPALHQSVHFSFPRFLRSVLFQGKAIVQAAALPTGSRHTAAGCFFKPSQTGNKVAYCIVLLSAGWERASFAVLWKIFGRAHLEKCQTCCAIRLASDIFWKRRRSNSCALTEPHSYGGSWRHWELKNRGEFSAQLGIFS